MGIVVLILTIGTIRVFAAPLGGTPAEVLAGITGRSLESTIAERAEKGNTYGTMAKDAGVLTEFREEMLQLKMEILAAGVAAGTLTQEEADEMSALLASHLDNCDASARGRGLYSTPCGFGFGGGHHQQRQQQECVKNREQVRAQDCYKDCLQGHNLAPCGDPELRDQCLGGAGRGRGQDGWGHGVHSLRARLRDGTCGK